MKKMIHLVLVLFIVATLATAHHIIYNVVSLINNTQTMGVIVDRKLYLLYPSDASSILHTGEAPIANEGYLYVIIKDNKIVGSENFMRTPTTSNTKNEYYKRSWNKWNLTKKFPQVLPPLMHRRESKLHIDGEIPTIHFVGDKDELDKMQSNQKQEDIKASVKMAYISPDKIKTFQDVEIKISGHSTRTFPKLSYKFTLPKKQHLFGYRKLKLRAMVNTDYSYMKEYLAYDMYHAVGLPTSQFSYVRVYINDEAIGLFGLVEDFKNPWPRNEFANGDKEYKQGTLFVSDINAGRPAGIKATDTSMVQQGGPLNLVLKGGADLDYLGDDLSQYKKGYYKVKEKPSKGVEPEFSRIMEFTRFLSDAPTDASLWEKQINVDSFLRGMAMEILLSNMDGYFALTNNYMLYVDPETKQLLFTGQDFDLTMGLGALNETMTGNYTQYPNFQNRPLTKILNVPQFKRRFEALLLNITSSIMNEDVLISRIDQVYEMLHDDVEWDRSLPKKGRFEVDLATKMWDGKTSDSILKEILYYITKGFNFNEAVNGPAPNNMNLVLPLKVWARTKRDNILRFFGST